MKIAVVGGCGRVGLPLSVVLANAGHQVVAIDIDLQRVAQISEGRTPFREDGLDELLRAAIASGRLEISWDLFSLVGAEVVFVVVGTDLDENSYPQNKSVIAAIEQLSPLVSSDTIVVLRSTVIAGTTHLVTQLLSQHTKRVAYCPERIAEGKAVDELGSIPQIIGCEGTSDTFDVLRNLFATIGIESLLATPREAELGKLILNTWRYSQFAIANEFYLLCKEHEVNYEQIRHLISHKYPRATGLVGSGLAGGPCLEKDTKQLLYGLKNESRLFGEVLRTHSGMVDHIIASLQHEYDLGQMVVALLGITFKPSSDDLRGSPALVLAKRLHPLVKELIVVDPYVGVTSPFAVVELLEAHARCDIAVIGTSHPEFKNFDFAKPVFDVFAT